MPKKKFIGNTPNITVVQIFTNYDGLDIIIFQLLPTCKNKDCADPLPRNQTVPEEDHRGQDSEKLPDHMNKLFFLY